MMLRTRKQWLDYVVEKGTDGSMVYDILRDWKECEGAKVRCDDVIADLLAVCKALVRIAVEDMPGLAHAIISWREATILGIAAITKADPE